MPVTLKCVVCESTSAFVIVCRCLMCSASILTGWSGADVLLAWCFEAQHPSSTKRGMGGMNTFLKSFKESRTCRRPRTCPTSAYSGDGTSSPIHSWLTWKGLTVVLAEVMYAWSSPVHRTTRVFQVFPEPIILAILIAANQVQYFFMNSIPKNLKFWLGRELRRRGTVFIFFHYRNLKNEY